MLIDARSYGFSLHVSQKDLVVCCLSPFEMDGIAVSNVCVYFKLGLCVCVCARARLRVRVALKNASVILVASLHLGINRGVLRL